MVGLVAAMRLTPRAGLYLLSWILGGGHSLMKGEYQSTDLLLRSNGSKRPKHNEVND